MPYRKEKERRIRVFWRYGDGKIICKTCRTRISPEVKALVTHVEGSEDSYRTQVCELCMIKELARDFFKWRSPYGKRMLQRHTLPGEGSEPG